MRCFQLVWSVMLAWAVWQPQAADPPSSELKAAQKLDVNKCARCHRRYQPSAYTQADWELWMDKMGRKSKLRPEQTDLLKRYPELLRREEGSLPAQPRKKGKQ